VRAFIVIFAFYLYVVSRAAPEYVRQIARAFGSTSPVQIAQVAARTSFGRQFIVSALRRFGPPPQRILRAAFGRPSSSRPDERRPAPEGFDASEWLGAGGQTLGSAVAGPIGGLIGGIAGSLLEGKVGPPSEPNEGRFTQGQKYSVYTSPDRFSAQQMRQYGASSTDDSNVGHLRFGECVRDGVQSCIAFEPCALRIGHDYIAATYCGRLAQLVADKFRDARGNLTPTGQRVLASAYLHTLRAVQQIPQDDEAAVVKFGFYPPTESTHHDGLYHLPPHLIDQRSTLLNAYGLFEAGWETISWVHRQRLITRQALKFLNAITNILHDEKPLEPDVQRALSQTSYHPTGEHSLRATRDNPPRIAMTRHPDATNFLPAEA